ncbi:hypothetical protein ES703_09390 [subsurface metagenome]
MAAEVEILGHKAKIESVKGQAKVEPWEKDRLEVWLSFEEPVDSILSFAAYLPVKKYEREEFLYNVRRRGEEELKRLLEDDQKERRKLEDRHQRQAAIDIVAAAAQRLIE